MRHAGGLSSNGAAATFDDESALARRAIDLLVEHVRLADEREAESVEVELRSAATDWAARAKASQTTLKFRSARDDGTRLLKNFGEDGIGWPTMHSMRSVEQGVRLRARGE
jgi:hypothetical protein